MHKSQANSLLSEVLSYVCRINNPVAKEKQKQTRTKKKKQECLVGSLERENAERQLGQLKASRTKRAVIEGHRWSNLKREPELVSQIRAAEAGSFEKALQEKADSNRDKYVIEMEDIEHMF